MDSQPRVTLPKLPYLSVVIPAYNEEKRIPRTLLALDHYLSGQKYSYEILVVNDGSTDNTAQVVKRFEDLVPHLRLLHNDANHGKGYVVRQGMLAAQGQVRLFTDADNSTTIDHFEKMVPLFDQGYDVVIGSRESKDASDAKQAISQPFVKRLVGDLANVLIQIVAVPGIWDTQAGFKACTAHAAQEIFSRARINRWGFDIEMLALARALRLRLGIIPIYWVNDPNSHVKLSGYLNTFRELFIIRMNLWRSAYNLPKGGIPDSGDASSLISSLQKQEEAAAPQTPPAQDIPAVPGEKGPSTDTAPSVSRAPRYAKRKKTVKK